MNTIRPDSAYNITSPLEEENLSQLLENVNLPLEDRVALTALESGHDFIKTVESNLYEVRSSVSNLATRENPAYFSIEQNQEHSLFKVIEALRQYQRTKNAYERLRQLCPNHLIKQIGEIDFLDDEELLPHQVLGDISLINNIEEAAQNIGKEFYPDKEAAIYKAISSKIPLEFLKKVFKTSIMSETSLLHKDNLHSLKFVFSKIETSGNTDDKANASSSIITIGDNTDNSTIQESRDVIDLRKGKDKPLARRNITLPSVIKTEDDIDERQNYIFTLPPEVLEIILNDRSLDIHDKCSIMLVCNDFYSLIGPQIKDKAVKTFEIWAKEIQAKSNACDFKQSLFLGNNPHITKQKHTLNQAVYINKLVDLWLSSCEDYLKKPGEKGRISFGEFSESVLATINIFSDILSYQDGRLLKIDKPLSGSKLLPPQSFIKYLSSENIKFLNEESEVSGQKAKPTKVSTSDMETLSCICPGAYSSESDATLVGERLLKAYKIANDNSKDPTKEKVDEIWTIRPSGSQPGKLVFSCVLRKSDKPVVQHVRITDAGTMTELLQQVLPRPSRTPTLVLFQNDEQATEENTKSADTEG